MRCKLGDISEITKLAGYEFTKYIKYIPDGEIIAVRALNLKNGALVLDDIQRISKEVSETLPRSQLHKNDIVLSYTGTLGECAQIREDGKYHLAPNVCKITPNDSVVNPNFLFQYIRCEKFKQTLINYAHGSTQPTIPMSTIRDIPVDIPDGLEKQGKIAAILSILDEKIAINRAINDNLEQQAQAIYTQYFIKNKAPNWKLGQLSDLILVKYGKDHKKLADGIYPVYGSGGIMRYVERPLYTGESVLIPRKGTLNNVTYVNGSFWSVDTMFYTEMLHPNVAKYVYLFLKSRDLASLNAGSAVPSMTTNILNAMQIYIPDKKVLAYFEEAVSPLYLTIQKNEEQSSTLVELRDALLPKLMSGELGVSAVNL